MLGKLLVLIVDLNFKNYQSRTKLDIANNIFNNIELNSEEQDQVREYLLITTVTKEKQNEFDALLAILCPSLKVQVTNSMMKKALDKNCVIQRLKELNSDNVSTKSKQISDFKFKFVNKFLSSIKLVEEEEFVVRNIKEDIVNQVEICFGTPEETMCSQGDVAN